MIDTNNKELKVCKRYIPFYAMRVEDGNMVEYYIGNDDYGNLLSCFGVEKKNDDPAYIANLENYISLFYEEFIKEKE